MPVKHSDLALLHDPVAQQFLHSTQLAHLAYIWDDGTPNAPKVHVLPHQTQVAITIDSNIWPYNALLIRGVADVTIIDGIVPEYEAAARRYFGYEQGQAWIVNVRQMAPQMARIAVRPTWVSILDCEQCFPSAIQESMIVA